MEPDFRVRRRRTKYLPGDLSEEEVQTLLIRYARLPYIIACRIRRDHHLKTADVGDFASEGTLGLIRAARTFRHNMNSSFAHYASLWIYRVELSCISRFFPTRLTRADRIRAYQSDGEGEAPGFVWVEVDAPHNAHVLDIFSFRSYSQSHDDAAAYEFIQNNLRKAIMSLEPCLERSILLAFLELEGEAKVCWATVARQFALPERTFYRYRDRALAMLRAKLRELFPAIMREIEGF